MTLHERRLLGLQAIALLKRWVQSDCHLDNCAKRGPDEVVSDAAWCTCGLVEAQNLVTEAAQS